MTVTQINLIVESEENLDCRSILLDIIKVFKKEFTGFTILDSDVKHLYVKSNVQA